MFPPRSFLAKPVHLIYYVFPIDLFSDPGSSAILLSTPQSFLAKSVHLVNYVLSPSLGGGWRYVGKWGGGWVGGVGGGVMGGV